MRKFKTVIAFILILSMGLSAFGCGPKESKYTITFNSNGGGDLAAIEFVKGEDVTLPTPLKEGFTFAGWYGNEDLNGNPVFTLVGAAEGNKEYWAKWVEAEYTVTYKDGNRTMSPQTGWLTKYKDADITSDILLPGDVTKNGYEFAGWFVAADLSGSAVTALAAGSTGNKTFYAKWNVNTYRVSFVTNIIGYAMDDVTYTIQANKILPVPEEQTYRTFDAWYETPDFTGIGISQIIRGSYGDKTFYAKWIADEFNIVYELNGGSFTEGDAHPEKYAYSDTEETALISPKKAGSSFGGWYENAAFSGTYLESIAAGSHGDKKFYAKWEEADNFIEYTLNGGVLSGKYPQSFKDGETVTLVNPTRFGYTFLGWYETADFTGDPVTTTGGTGNKHFYAKWVIAGYTVHFELNGGSFANGADKDFVYTSQDMTINLNANAYKPERDGFAFGGWYQSPEFAGSATVNIPTGSTGNKTFYAKWTIKTYKVTFMLSGGSLGAQPTEASYTITTSVSLPKNDPTRDGYSFGGWFNDSNFTTISAGVSVGSVGDKMIYAKWTANTYTLTYNANGGTMPGKYPQQYTFGNMEYLPVPTLSGKVFGGWYEEPVSAPDVKKVLGAVSNKTFGDKALYALWLDGGLSSAVSQKMEAENTDLTGKSGPGGSGSQSEGGMVSTEYTEASGGMCIPWTRGPGVYIDWEFALDRQVSDAALEIQFGSEIGNVTFNNKSTAIYINGVLYEKAWSVLVADRTFASFTISGIALRAGYNVIRIEVLPNNLAVGFDAGGPVFDCITVSSKANIGWKPIIWKEI